MVIQTSQHKAKSNIEIIWWNIFQIDNAKEMFKKSIKP